MAVSPASNVENDNVFEDLSGISGMSSGNPYNALMEACKNTSEIQARYGKHRETRNAAQRQKYFVAEFTGVTIDPILYKLVNPQQHPDFADTRHCLVFWARPTMALRELIGDLQKRLLIVAPTLEIAFSLTASEIDDIVNQMKSKIAEITDYPYHHRARLIKPMLSYDTAAIALSFEPAAGESVPDGRSPTADAYTYHHLRRDLYELSKDTGVEVSSRYVVPSAHLTIARFVTQIDVARSKEDHRPEPGKVRRLLDCIERVNLDLREQYWPEGGKDIKAGGVWIVGEEKGLDCRKGTLWYGGGETVRLGKGF
ncbi:MAG: hypothetical protein Q9218_003011 [Villophora microphyllina]